LVERNSFTSGPLSHRAHHHLHQELISARESNLVLTLIHVGLFLPSYTDRPTCIPTSNPKIF